jgi:hypothetical protein
MVKDLNRFVRTNYITGASLEPGVRYEDRVSFVDERAFDGDDDSTSILVFETGRRLPLNQTNLKEVIKAYGPNPDNVTGQTIIYFRKMVEFAGKPVPGVRIECQVADRIAAQPAARPALSSVPKPDIRTGPRAWDKHAEEPPPPAEYEGPDDSILFDD